MSNQVNNPAVTATVNSKEVSYIANGEEVKLSGTTVRNYLVRGNKDVTDQEVVMFINLCKFQKLNPFLNEAYLVKFGDEAQIITSKEAFMKRATRSPDYNGQKAGIIVERNGEIVELEGCFSLSTDKLLGGWCNVFLKNMEHPVTSKINLEEFSKGQATWNQMPKNMIRKTAIVQALREAFPEDLGALYTEEETQDSPVNIEQEIEQKANTEELDFKKPTQKKEDEVIDAEYEEIKEGKQIEGQMDLVSEDVPY